jgi:hypothetical protein
VLLYDQEGRPIDNAAGCTVDGEEVQRLETTPPAPANAFPQQQRVLGCPLDAARAGRAGEPGAGSSGAAVPRSGGGARSLRAAAQVSGELYIAK